MSEMLDGEEIVQARIRGESARSIATLSLHAGGGECCAGSLADLMIDDNVGKHTLALELARLDEL